MKGLKIIFTFISAVALLTGCSSADRSADTLREQGSVTVALQQGYSLEGLSQYIADRLGAKPVYVSADKQAALTMLADGSADIAVGYFSESENPGLAFGLTVPFHTENIYAVCLEDEFVTSLAGLSGELLGADEQLSESTVRELSDASADGKLYCNSMAAASEMLKANELDAFICFESRAAELVQSSEGLRCYQLSDMQAERYCTVVLRENAQLYGEVNSAVGEYLKGGNTDGIF